MHVDPIGMSVVGQISEVLANPNVAYLLLTLGILGVVAELASPGLVFPSVIGAVALVLAFIGFAELPVTVAGLVLIGVAAVLLVAELYVDGFGVLGVAGIASFALGSALLFERDGAGAVAQVSPWLIILTTIVVAGCFFTAVRLAHVAHRAPVRTGVEALVGRTGVAATAIAPTGVVDVDGEDWTAQATDAEIPAGAPVEVTGVDGVVLRIKELPA